MDFVKNRTYIRNYTATHARTGSNLFSRRITDEMMGVPGTVYSDKADKMYSELRDREDLSKAFVLFAASAFQRIKPFYFPILIFCPDLILVLSLKGHFLYVSSSVSPAFGYDEDWSVGRTSPICATSRTTSPPCALSRRLHR